jgi:MinD-like ATPase involved in chromosome partitioning or flagellar assembly
MGIVALIGDCTTTTAVAAAAAWPREAEVVVLEADRTGGSLAGWLDTPTTPSLSTLVAARSTYAATTDPAPDGTRRLQWSDVDDIIHRTASGIRFVAAPLRAREASRAIDEAGRSLVPLLASNCTVTFLADVGRVSVIDHIPAVVAAATTIVVIHRQDASSPGAAGVRLERTAELVEHISALGADIVLAVVGDQPFDVADIADHIAARTSAHLSDACSIAVDPLSAMVLAGRTGVSAKRLARLPLARSIGTLVGLIAPSVAEPVAVEAELR